MRLKILLGGALLCFCLNLNAYAGEELAEIKGALIGVELEPSKDPESPNFWPCLLLENKQFVMLVGDSDTLEELYYLIGKEAVLKAKPLPKQKFGGREYECFEAGGIEKIDGWHYLSAKTAVGEFQEALIQRKGALEEKEEKEKSPGRIKSVWFDKNRNGDIDTGDRLFVANLSTGKSEGKYLLYSSQGIVRQIKDGNAYYETFIFRDPLAKSFEPALLGTLNYNQKENICSVAVDKIYDGRQEALREPQESEKNIALGRNDRLKYYHGLKVLLSGENYENVLWFAPAPEDISRQDGQYIVNLKGKILISKIAAQKPWELTLVLLQDSRGKTYEIRQIGSAEFWKDYENKEIAVTGALRQVVNYDGILTCVVEVFKIN